MVADIRTPACCGITTMATIKKAKPKETDRETRQQGPEQAREGMSRRRMLGLTVSSLAGGGVALPLAAAGATAKFNHEAPSSAAKDGGAAPGQAAGWQPRFLDAHQAATLIAIEKRIAPGAAQAKTHEFIRPELKSAKMKALSQVSKRDLGHPIVGTLQL